jgi:hypothetical protein
MHGTAVISVMLGDWDSLGFPNCKMGIIKLAL